MSKNMVTTTHKKNAIAAACPRMTPLRILSRKWSYVVLRTLDEPKHFSELLRELRLITNRMLSRELSLLQQERLIDSQKGNYERTTAGTALLAAADHLNTWSVKHTCMENCPDTNRCSSCDSFPAFMSADRAENKKK